MRSSELSRKRTFLPESLSAFLVLSVVLTALSILYVLWRVKFDPAPHHHLPVDVSTVYLRDLTYYEVQLGLRHTVDFYVGGVRFLYPAPMVWPYLLFLKFSAPGTMRGTCIAYLVFVAAGVAALCWGFVAALRRRGFSAAKAWMFVLVSVLCCWPLAYAVHHGNMEPVVTLGVFLALWAYSRERWMLFALLIGFFAAFKLHPILFLGLLLRPRRYKELAAGVGVFVAFTAFSEWWLGPGFVQACKLSAGVISFFSRNSLSPATNLFGMTFDHSLGNGLRAVLHTHLALVGRLLHWYLPVLGVATVVLFFGRVWKMPALNQIFFLSLIIVSVPCASFDYTLLLLYAPWGMLVLQVIDAWREGERVRCEGAMLVLLAITLSCEVFLATSSRGFYGQTKALALLLLLALVVRYPLEREPGRDARDREQRISDAVAA